MSQPFIIERVINAPVGRIWKALTDPSQMKEWYFDIPGFEAKKGFEFQFEGGPPERSYTHLCKITEVVDKKKLQHTWSYKGYEGMSVVTWELTDMGSKTKVKLTHTGLDTFPNIEDFARKNFEAGWNGIVGKSLPEYLKFEI